MSILDVIERARQEPAFADPERISSDEQLVCRVLDPTPWDRSALERNLNVEIPDDLAKLWGSCGGLILYEDTEFRQWGLVVRSPPHPDVATLNREYREDKAARGLPGDLVFARFWGDRERPLIRTDKAAADYATIMIVDEMDPRSYWYTVAQTLEDFLTRFMDAHGKKYWEYQYQKERVDHGKESKG
jgi:hypothetical protein